MTNFLQERNEMEEVMDTRAERSGEAYFFDLSDNLKLRRCLEDKAFFP